MRFINKLLLCTINILFLFSGIILNSIVIFSLMNSQLRRKLCYFMILVMACFDLAVVIVLHPAAALASLDPSRRCPSMIWGQLQIFSLAAMSAMTLERYLALMHPFFHQRFLTKSRLLIILVMMQLPFTVMYGTLEMTKHVTIAGVSLALYVCVFITIFFFNYKILVVARKIRHETMAPLGQFGEHADDEHEAFRSTKQHAVVLKKISTCSLAVACLTVCFLPHVLYAFLGLTGQLDDWTAASVFTFHLWIDTLTGMNSSFNCVIFFYINSTLRRHACKIFRHRINCMHRP